MIESKSDGDVMLEAVWRPDRVELKRKMIKSSLLGGLGCSSSSLRE